MSQITRCPACATMFKVVADQLRVAQGWVRCGQCGEVFEASLHRVTGVAGDAGVLPPALQGMAGKTALPQAIRPPFSVPDHAGNPLPESPEAAGVPPIAPEAAPDVRTPDGGFADAAAEAEPKHTATAPGRQVEPGISLPGEKPHLAGHPAGAEAVAASPAGSEEGRHEPVFRPDGFGFKPFASGAEATGPEFQASPVSQDSQAFPDVAFVRQARRKDFWKSPWVRGVLGMVCLLLALALVLQWAVRQKDVLAAQAPQLAPWLQAICRPLGCEIRPLRRIQWVVIENSSFSRTGPDAYRLSFTFMNTGNADLEIPALEVTLTDTQDRAVVRRVVMPAEFGATATTLAAYSKLAGALTLKVAGAGGQDAIPPAPAGFLPVAGYRILAFYP
jgi:predicted Zn finger-like uncharacterized protein